MSRSESRLQPVRRGSGQTGGKIHDPRHHAEDRAPGKIGIGVEREVQSQCDPLIHQGEEQVGRAIVVRDVPGDSRHFADVVNLVHADASDRQTPERALLDRSVSDDVQRSLDALPDDFRTAVVLCDVQGLSYKEIAEIMQTPVGTVMSRLFRGRKLLAASLREFAQVEGYVRGEAVPTKDTEKTKTIDLDKYRAARTSRDGTS